LTPCFWAFHKIKQKPHLEALKNDIIMMIIGMRVIAAPIIAMINNTAESLEFGSQFKLQTPKTLMIIIPVKATDA
jgi:hypothetical protein